MECPPPNLLWLSEADIYSNPGPLTYFTVAGQGVLVLNTRGAAADLLERRGHIYSDRPRMISKCRRWCHPQPLPTANHDYQWQTK